MGQKCMLEAYVHPQHGCLFKVLEGRTVSAYLVLYDA